MPEAEASTRTGARPPFPLGQLVPAQDAAVTAAAIRNGRRLLSSYGTGDAKLWIITEADRSVTTVLRPDDY